MSTRISIVLVDDGTGPESSIVSRLRGQPGFVVLAALANVEAALEQVRRSRPNIVLLNLRQVGDEIQTLAGAIYGSTPESRVIVMGLEAPQEDIARFLRAGVRGFIMAGASFGTFLDTLHSVTRGLPVLPAELTHSLFRQIKKHGVLGRPERVTGASRLTAREFEVAELIAEGLTNRAIAARLLITLHTVKTHVHRVLMKLAVNSRLEIAALSTPLHAHSSV